MLKKIILPPIMAAQLMAAPVVAQPQPFLEMNFLDPDYILRLTHVAQIICVSLANSGTEITLDNARRFKFETDDEGRPSVSGGSITADGARIQYSDALMANLTPEERRAVAQCQVEFVNDKITKGLSIQNPALMAPLEEAAPTARSTSQVTRQDNMSGFVALVGLLSILNNAPAEAPQQRSLVMTVDTLMKALFTQDSPPSLEHYLRLRETEGKDTAFTRFYLDVVSASLTTEQAHLLAAFGTPVKFLQHLAASDWQAARAALAEQNIPSSVYDGSPVTVSGSDPQMVGLLQRLAGHYKTNML